MHPAGVPWPVARASVPRAPGAFPHFVAGEKGHLSGELTQAWRWGSPGCRGESSVTGTRCACVRGPHANWGLLLSDGANEAAKHGWCNDARHALLKILRVWLLGAELCAVRRRLGSKSAGAAGRARTMSWVLAVLPRRCARRRAARCLGREVFAEGLNVPGEARR